MSTLASDPPLLSVEGVTVRFGGIVALNGVSFSVPRGAICGIIGANGAGKTTLFNVLSRFYACQEGRIDFDGRDLLALPAHGIAATGIGRTFQNLALFPTMSVLDHLRVGGHVDCRSGWGGNLLGLRGARKDDQESAERARELADLLQLTDVLDRVVADLPFGVQKRVELARALACRPKLLLLDEPAGGLHHEEVDVLRDLISRLARELSVTVLLVEHHMNLVMRVSDTVVALEFGKTIRQGTPDEVRADPQVIASYLGTA